MLSLEPPYRKAIINYDANTRNNMLVRSIFLVHTLIGFFCILSFSLWAFGSLGKYHWTVTFRPLLARYRWEDGGKNLNAETYYDRDCDRNDFSTSDFESLIISEEWDSTMAAENILIHGVSVFPKVIDRELANAFRNYTLERNKHLQPEEMVYVMNAKTKSKQTRWSFAFTANDQPLVIPKVLEQIVHHKKLIETLELFLGKDPAIIKMQTITQSYKAEHQGWHPDVNAQASVKSHARNFMMHFSLFITLQDTTPKMGATGVCPGTQYCSRVEDFELGCKQVTSGNKFTNANTTTNINMDTGIWLAGDAVLMNQNTFHRGWKHDMQNGPDRALIVLTFTSRPRYSNGRKPQHPAFTPLPSQRWTSYTHSNNESAIISSLDAKNFPIQSWVDERKKLIHPESRVLSLGTPLTSFGFTLYDLKDPLVSMSKLLTVLRYFGIYKTPDASWGWDYATSLLSRISTETHKYKKEDLSSWLSSQRNHIRQNKKSTSVSLRLRSIFMEWYMKQIITGMPASTNKHMGIWDIWISLNLTKGTNYFKKYFSWTCGTYILLSILTAWILSPSGDDDGDDDNSNLVCKDPEMQQGRDNYNRQRRQRRQEIFHGTLMKSFLRPLKMFCALFSLLIFVHWKVQSCILVRDIRSGRIIRNSFPDVNNMRETSRSLSLLPIAGVRRITHGRGNIGFVRPTRDDVLIGTRFDSLYLRIVNRFLDYHTGNRVWRKLVREVSACTDKGLFFSVPDIVPNSVIDSILRKTKGNLLLQAPETGKFTMMTNGESRIFTRRALILEHSLLLSELDRSISFIIAEMRFESTLRTTPLALFTVGVLEIIREKIFGESDTVRAFLNTDEQKKRSPSWLKQMKPDSIISRPLSHVRLVRTIVKTSVATIPPEKIKLCKGLRKHGPVKLQLHLTKTVPSNRKRKTNARANVQTILELKRQKRQR